MVRTTKLRSERRVAPSRFLRTVVKRTYMRGGRGDVSRMKVGRPYFHGFGPIRLPDLLSRMWPSRNCPPEPRWSLKSSATQIMQPMLNELRQEGETTKRLLDRIPVDKLDWKPHPKSMSLGQLAVHIASIP